MTSKAQKIRVGLFVTVSLVLIGIVLIVFGGLRFWENSAKYKIVFAGSVMGLEPGAQVYLNGMRVGRVDEIRSAEDLTKVEVDITVKADTPVHADTKAMLQLAGITGLKTIDLQGGTRSSPRLAEGSTIPEGQTTLDKLASKAEQLADQSTQILNHANRIVDNLVQVTDPNKFEGIAEIMAETRRTAHNLALTTDAMHAMIAENRAAVKASLASVQEVAHSASDMIDGQVTGLVVNATDFISELKGLVRNNESTLRSAMFDLRQASRNFKELSRDVRQRPSRLLFSSDPSDRKLP